MLLYYSKSSQTKGIEEVEEWEINKKKENKLQYLINYLILRWSMASSKNNYYRCLLICIVKFICWDGKFTLKISVCICLCKPHRFNSNLICDFRRIITEWNKIQKKVVLRNQNRNQKMFKRDYHTIVMSEKLVEQWLRWEQQ